MTKLFKKPVSILLSVMMIMSVFASVPVNAAVTQKYVKVTSAPDDWSGEYLIVYEDSESDEPTPKAFNGGLDNLDVVKNTIDVVIVDDKIEANDTTTAAQFTIADYDGGYSIKAASNKYIGNTTNQNRLQLQDSPIKNIIEWSNNAVSIKSTANQASYLRYNTTDPRFRYYKTGQQPIALYKLSTCYTITWKLDADTEINTTEVAEGTRPTHEDPTKDEDENYIYTFTGWTDSSDKFYEAGDDLPEATGNETYTAQFDAVLKSSLPIQKYVKVTSEPTDWSGEYLIVYEDGKLAFDGSSNSLGNNQNINVTIADDNTIEANDTTNASKFTIAKIDDNGNYSIKSASDRYIGNGSNVNGQLNVSTSTVYQNTIELDDGNQGVLITSNNTILRYHSGTRTKRFLYYT